MSADAKRTEGGTLNGHAPGPRPTEAEREMYSRLAGRYEQTLGDAVSLTSLDHPVSHDDLMGTYRALRERGIAHNMMYSKGWMEAIYGPACEQCGRGMNPAEAMLGPVCGACARRNHREAAGR